VTADTGEHTQYHTPHIRLIIEVDGVQSVWEWRRDALIPIGPQYMPDHTTFYFDIVAYTRRMKQGRWAGGVPMPLLCKDYADGEYICGLSAQE
jgi:hypothetical protein